MRADVRPRHRPPRRPAADLAEREQRLGAEVGHTDRHDGEVEPAQPEGGQPDEEGEGAPHDGRGEQPHQPGQAELGDAGDEAGGERADADEGVLAERDLAGVAEQQVERQRGDGEGRAAAQLQCPPLRQQPGLPGQRRDDGGQQQGDEDAGDRHRATGGSDAAVEGQGAHVWTAGLGRPTGPASRVLTSGQKARPSSASSSRLSTTM